MLAKLKCFTVPQQKAMTMYIVSLSLPLDHGHFERGITVVENKKTVIIVI